jgi:hypothetical protein
MMHLGIEPHYGLVYEGPGTYGGRAVWPTPVITPAKIVFVSEGPLLAQRSNEIANTSCRFREDHFDPVSRTRRGRFYFGDGVNQQPTQWHLQPHPAIPSEERSRTMPTKDLETFVGRSVYRMLTKAEQPLVLLGLDERFTVWKVVNIEAISASEDMVTLKSRSSFGILPEIDRAKIPPAFEPKLRETLDAFVQEVHRASPVSVIDRARDTVSQILIGYYELFGEDAKDLGQMVKRLDEGKKVIAASSAKIVARLHARAKPVEQEKNTLRPIREQDAELATYCVGTILCELGWADWV